MDTWTTPTTSPSISPDVSIDTGIQNRSYDEPAPPYEETSYGLLFSEEQSAAAANYLWMRRYRDGAVYACSRVDLSAFESLTRTI